MSYLSQIVTGAARQTGQRIVISGIEGVGKTTLATGAARSLLVPLEAGHGTVTTARLPNVLTSWGEIENFVSETIASAKAGKFPYQSIVWDTATALERLAQEETLRVDTAGQKKFGKGHNMATAHDGYGKAYLVARSYFSQWLGWLDQLSLYGGINNIVTCHVFAATISDPSQGDYQSFDLLLHAPKDQKNYGARELLTQWADCVAFLHSPIIVMKNEGDKHSRGISSNQGRVLAVDRAPAYTAKNRYGLHESISIPAPPACGWNNFADAVFKSCAIDLFNRDIVPTNKEA